MASKKQSQPQKATAKKTPNWWRRTIPPLTPTEAAWLAGFLDGEGCFTITYRPVDATHKTGYHQAAIYVSNTCREPLDWFANKFSVAVKSHDRTPGKHKEIFSTQISGHRACLLAETLLPYLKVKRRQALIFIRYGKTHTNTPAYEARVSLTAEAIRARKNMHAAITKLNRKGVA